jgi:alkylhydroperoxidase family enzyme
MSFVKVIPPGSADVRMQQQYDYVRESVGSDDYLNLTRAWSTAPEVAEAWMHSQATSRRVSGLSDVQYELMECRIMYLTKSRYVLVNHAFILQRISGWDDDQLRRNIRDPENSSLEEKDKALLRFAARVALRSHETAQADIDELKTHGYADEQIVALVFLIGSLVQNGIVPNALGAELDGFSRRYRDLVDW